MKYPSAVDIAKQGDLGYFLKYHKGLQLCFEEKYKTSARQPKQVLWITGESGCGKTYRATHFYEIHPEYTAEDIFVHNGDCKWWDGYRGQRVVVLNEFRDRQCTWDHLLVLTDVYPTLVQVKGSTVNFDPEWVIITSVLRPEECYQRKAVTAWNEAPRME